MAHEFTVVSGTRDASASRLCVSRALLPTIWCTAWSHNRASSASTLDAEFGPPPGRNGGLDTAHPSAVDAIRI